MKSIYTCYTVQDAHRSFKSDYIYMYKLSINLNGLLRLVVRDASGGPKPLILPLEPVRLCLGVSSVESNPPVMEGGRVRVWSPVSIR